MDIASTILLRNLQSLMEKLELRIAEMNPWLRSPLNVYELIGKMVVLPTICFAFITHYLILLGYSNIAFLPFFVVGSFKLGAFANNMVYFFSKQRLAEIRALIEQREKKKPPVIGELEEVGN